MSQKPQDTSTDAPRFVLAQNFGWILVAMIVIAGSLSQKYVEQFFADREFALPAVARDASRDSTVLDTLYGLMHKTEAARAYVYVLHNGGYVAGKIPFKKMSCVAEVVGPGVSREISNAVNIPLSAVPELVDALVANGGTIEWVVPNMPESTFKAALAAKEIYSVKMQRVLVGDELWGFVGVDYLTEQTGEDYATVGSCVGMAARLIELELEKTKVR